MLHKSVEDLVLSTSMLCHVFSAAESLLAHTLALQQGGGDLAAAWTASSDVRKATETLLGVPDWHSLSQPLLRALMVCASPFCLPLKSGAVLPRP